MNEIDNQNLYVSCNCFLENLNKMGIIKEIEPQNFIAFINAREIIK